MKDYWPKAFDAHMLDYHYAQPVDWEAAAAARQREFDRMARVAAEQEAHRVKMQRNWPAACEQKTFRQWFSAYSRHAMAQFRKDIGLQATVIV